MFTSSYPTSNLAEEHCNNQRAVLYYTLVMPLDTFSRVCLSLIVVLLAVIAWRTTSNATAHAAITPTYLYENIEKGGATTQEPTLTAHMNAMAKQGWHFNSSPYGGLVWEK